MASLGVATATLTGCAEEGPDVRVGNLVPPPPVEVCIAPTPSDARVELSGRETRCIDVMPGAAVDVVVSAPGYQPHREKVRIERSEERPITLAPALEPAPEDPAPDGGAPAEEGVAEAQPECSTLVEPPSGAACCAGFGGQIPAASRRGRGSGKPEHSMAGSAGINTTPSEDGAP